MPPAYTCSTRLSRASPTRAPLVTCWNNTSRASSTTHVPCTLTSSPNARPPTGTRQSSPNRSDPTRPRTRRAGAPESADGPTTNVPLGALTVPTHARASSHAIPRPSPTTLETASVEAEPVNPPRDTASRSARKASPSATDPKCGVGSPSAPTSLHDPFFALHRTTRPAALPLTPT